MEGNKMIYPYFKQIPMHFFLGIPVIIPSFNQLYYVKNTIKQLKRFGLFNFIILDNGSTYPPLVKWFEETKIPVVIDLSNPGPRTFFTDSEIWERLPNYFIVTDPDLEYNEKTPDSLVDDLIEISETFCFPKIALALDKSDTEAMIPIVEDCEGGYWKTVIARTKYGDPIYDAKTDTTFALYNKKFVTRPGLLAWDADFFTAPRIAGRFTCKHWGWYYKKPVPKNEHEYYKNTATHWSSTEHELKKRGIDA
jgi:glycosyltransferase involved in cell wall biosynthesis